jgi:acetyl-CoA C-acetyltransferase
MVSIMDVDMAAAVILASEEKADALGVPLERRVYPRGWCYATDPVYVAEHDDMWRSPAMAAASAEALRIAGVGVDEVAHLDLYSCFGSSVNFARDALGLRDGDPRGVTVTGGLPYQGGAGSDYMTHSIAQMATVLRDDPGSFGITSGVGMHMTKHVYGVYSTTPPPAAAPRPNGKLPPREPQRAIVEHCHDEVVIASYTVHHGRDGEPTDALLVCDVDDRTRCYAKSRDANLLQSLEAHEWVGAEVGLVTVDGVNVVRA